MSERLPPFEPLPADQRALRRRAVRDGLIISGWLATLFTLIVVSSAARSLGYDAYSYWSIDFGDLYGRAVDSNFTLGAFRYTPPIAFLFAPLGLLPWWLFVWLWEATMVAIIVWLSGRWTLVVLALPPVALELYHGNIHLLIAAAVALGFRFPWIWSFVLLSKITPGVGLLWFAVRREWGALAWAIGATAILAAGSAIVAPDYWAEFVNATLSNLGQPQYYSIPPPLFIRLPAAALLVIWGARTDRPWTVPIGAMLGLPILWPHGLTVALAAIPFLRRGDRAALQPDWRSAADWRRLAVILAAFLGAAVALAAVFGAPIRQALDFASQGLRTWQR